MTSAGELSVLVSADMKRFTEEVSNGATQAGNEAGTGLEQSFTGKLVGIGQKIAGVMAVAFAGNQVVDYFKDSVGAASDFNEVVSKTKNVFGEASQGVLDWSKDAARSFGLSQTAALEAASSFGDMFLQMGFTAEGATANSKSVVQLATDLGSFNNLPTEDVLAGMASAFRGEYDSIQRVLPAMKGANVEQKALEMTGKDAAASLTDEEKATAALALMMEYGERASGDFQETSDGLANSQKIAKAAFDDVKAAVGQGLLPIFEKFSAFLADTVAPFITNTLVPAFSTFMAFVTDVILPKLGDLWDKFQQILNILKPLITEGLEVLKTTLQNIWDVLKPFLEQAWALFQTGLQWVIDNLPKVMEKLNELKDWAEDNEGKIKAVGTAITVVMLPALVQMGVGWIVAGTKALIGAAMNAAAWISMIAWMAIYKTAATLLWLWDGIKWVAGAAKAVASAVVYGAAWLILKGFMIAYKIQAIAFWIADAARWVAGAAKAVASAAVYALGWLIVQGAMLAAKASAIVTFIFLGIQWVIMAATAMVNAIIVAAAWVIAFWPVALIVLAIIALIAIVWIFWDEIKAALTKVGEFFTNVWNTIWQTIQTVWDWILEKIGAAIQWIKDKFQMIKDWILEKWQAIKDKATEIWDAIKQKVSDVVDGIKQWIIDFVVGVIRKWEEIKFKAQQVWDDIKAKVKSTVDGLLDFIKELPQKIKDFFSNAKDWLVEAGKNVVQGLLDGIKKLAGTVGKFFLDLLPSWIVGPFKSALGIGSPSKVFAGFGKDIGNGLMLGMDSQADQIAASADDMAQAAIPDFRNAASLMGEMGDLAVKAGSVNLAAAVPEQNAPIVKVFIGDKELKGLVRVEMVEQRRSDSLTLAMGSATGGAG